MAAPKTSKRPKARPMPEDMPSNRALSSATRPKARPEKMAKGGMCRGGGKATKGKSYSKAG